MSFSRLLLSISSLELVTTDSSSSSSSTIIFTSLSRDLDGELSIESKAKVPTRWLSKNFAKSSCLEASFSARSSNLRYFCLCRHCIQLCLDGLCKFCPKSCFKIRELPWVMLSEVNGLFLVPESVHDLLMRKAETRTSVFRAKVEIGVSKKAIEILRPSYRPPTSPIQSRSE